MYDLQKKDEQEQQKNDDESLKNSELHGDEPQDQVDSEQKSSNELQGSNEDNNQQETNNLVGNNDAEKQQENQQNVIDLPQQDDQSKKNLENKQNDGKNCTKIQASTHKTDDTTGETESYHKMVPLYIIIVTRLIIVLLTSRVMRKRKGMN